MKSSFVAIWIALAIAVIGMSMVNPLLPVFAEEMGASGVWLGLAFSGFAITQVPLAPLMGRLADKVGKKKLIIGGLLVYSAVALGYSVAPTYQILVILRAVSGVGVALIIPAVHAYVGDISPVGHEGRYMGILSIAFSVGWATGPLSGGIIKDAYGTDATYYTLTALSIAALFIILIFLKPVKMAAQHRTEAEGPKYLRRMLRHPVVRGILSMELIWGLTYGAIFSFLALFMLNNLQSTTSQVGIVLSLRAGVSALLLYPFGYLADRINRTGIITVGGIVMSAAIVAFAGADSFVMMVVLMTFVSLADSLIKPSLTAITLERGRELGMGSIWGLYSMASGGGMVIGGVVTGWVVDLANDIGAAFWFAGAAILAGLLVFNYFMLQDRRARRRASLPTSSI